MVYFRIQGGLGNMMFQYAAAASLKRGPVAAVCDKTALERLRRYPTVFPGLETVEEPPFGAAVAKQEKCDPIQFPPDDGRNVYIEGYFQSENYFDRDVALRAFEPRPERIAALRGKYGSWLSRPGVTAVSVRRGDYLRNPGWHPFVGEKYFRDCIAALDGANDFIVCSNGLDWCRRFFPTAFPGKRFLFAEGGSDLDDLALQTLCENNIASNSSYSWWGAWLGAQRRRQQGLPGRALMPSMWYGRVARRCGAKWGDIYFDGAEIVRNGYSLRRYLSTFCRVFGERD